MQIEIDPKSGFCFGVVYAIEKAEEELSKYGSLYCLGDIVHNNVEVRRLQEKGLITITHDEFRQLKNSRVLIRAHGEPPETYKIARENNIELIEASCPVVLKLQERIRKGNNELAEINGQVVIYGMEGHAEVNGLVGQTNGTAIVINSMEDLKKIDFSRPVFLYAQTTKSKKEYSSIQEEIKKQMTKFFPEGNIPFKANNTICGQVSERDKQIKDFANKHDVILFVSGKKSSNGKMLYNICKSVNTNSYFLSDEADLGDISLDKAKSIGICGATSTPRWLMEKIAEHIRKNLL